MPTNKNIFANLIWSEMCLAFSYSKSIYSDISFIHQESASSSVSGIVSAASKSAMISFPISM